MNLRNLLLLFISILFWECQNKGAHENNKSVIEYKVENFGNEFFCWNEILANIDPIQLETTSKSVIGRLTKGIVDSNNIYIMDFISQQLTKFNIDGKFIEKLGKRGKGPGEYRELRDVCITDDYVYCLDYKKIMYYDKVSGEYVGSLKFNTDDGFNPASLAVFDQSEYYLWNSNPDVWDKTSGDYFRMKKIKKGKVVSQYFKYNFKNSDYSRFSKSNMESYFINPIDGEYVAYKLYKDSVVSSVKFNFGTKMLTPKEVDDLRKSDIPNAYLKSNYFKNISNILETKAFIYFNCTGPDAKKYEGLINKETDKIKFGRWDYKRSPRLFYSDGIHLYGYYEPSQLLKEIENEEINSCFNSVREKSKNIKIGDNYILVKIYLN